MITILEVFCCTAALTCIVRVSRENTVPYNRVLMAGGVLFTAMAFVSEGVLL